MKPLLLFLTLVCTAHRGVAQPDEGSIKRFHDYVNEALRQQSSNRAAAKTTGLKQRLAAISSYYGMIRDSVHYSYNSNRGSAYDLNTMAYNDHYFCDYNAAYPYSLTTIGVMCNTYTKWHFEILSTVPVLDSIANFDYNSQDEITRYTCDDYQYPPTIWHYGNENYFDGQGRLVKSRYRRLDNFNLHDSDFSYFYYDAQNRVVADSAYAYNNGSVWLYMVQSRTYLANGKLNKLHFEIVNVDEDNYTHEYDAGNRLQTLRKDDIYGSNGSLKDSFVYDGTHQYVQAIYERIKPVTTDPWVNFHFWEKHFNASGLPDTMYTGYYDQATHSIKDTENKIVYIYNSYDNPVEMYYALGSSGGYYNTQYYYYDEYTEGINEQPTATDLKLYPNPTHNIITITSAQLLNKRVHIQLYNTPGQLLKNDQIVWNNSGYQLSLAGYREGMYWIVVKDDAGAVLCREMVLKQ